MAKGKKNKKIKEESLPEVNPELSGFDIKINTFGEIESSFTVDKLNKFLSKNLKDKKLTEKDSKKRKKK